jgi:outer membrane murein-binding lipoprotein Lpp
MRSSLVLLAMVLSSGFASGCASQKTDDDFLTQMLEGRAPKAQLSSTERAEVEKHPLGSEENPVLAQGPPGERAYLYRLRCPEGKPPILSVKGQSQR